MDIETIRFVSAKAQPKTQLRTLPGTHVRLHATVVKVASSLVEGGRRVTDSNLDYWVNVRGKWFLIDQSVGDYLKPKCGLGSG